MCGGDDEGGAEGEEEEEADDGTLNEGDQGGVGEEEGSRLQRDGATAASCDSLFWDDYGVKPQVENPSLEEQDAPTFERGGQIFFSNHEA